MAKQALLLASVLSIAFGPPALAQPDPDTYKKVLVGFKIGGTMMKSSSQQRADVPQFVTIDETIRNSYLVYGPSVDFLFRPRFSVESGLLYRSVERTYTRVEVNSRYNETTNGSRWDVPFLLKYWFGDDETFPYLLAGTTLAIQPSTSGIGTTVTPSTNPSRPLDVNTVTTNVSRSGGAAAGLTGGAGFSKPAWKLKVSAEVRYTYWTNTTNVPRAHEVLGLFGISF